MKKSIAKRTLTMILAPVMALSCGIAAFAGNIVESTTEALPAVISGASGNFGFWFGIGLFVCGAVVAAAVVFLKVRRDSGEV